jgi:hypothetical protein
MMVPAAYAAAKQYKDYKSAKNRDKAKVKKYSLGGDILTQFKDIMTGSKDSKISKAKEGLKKQIAEGRAKMRDKAKVKKYSKGGGADTGTRGEARSKTAVLFNKLLRNQDRPTKSDIKDVFKRRSRNEDRITNRDIESASSAIKGYSKGMSKEDITREGKRGIAAGKAVGESLRDKNAPMKRQRLADRQPSKKMGGGMMMKPMGYDYGGKVKTKPASKKRKDEGPRDDTFDPIFNKPEGMKKELAFTQIDDAISRKNIGDGKKMTRRGLMKVVDAAADDRQLGRSLRKFERDVFKTGGSVMARGCKLGRNKKTKLY